MKLQERDFEVLAALERWGVMGLGQVDGILFHKEVSGEERARLFFNEVRREDYWGRAYKRLSGLEKLGLVRIKRFPYSWPVYMLTARGFEFLKRHGRPTFETPSQGVSDRLVRHEVAVVGVGLVLTRALGLKVMTARQIWDDFYRRNSRQHREARLAMPDFLVDDARGVRHILEVELTAKSRKRYGDIFHEHSRRLPHMEAQVLYLVDWPGGVEHIGALSRKYGVSSVQAAQLADFRASLGRCRFATEWRREPFAFERKPEPKIAAPMIAEPVGEYRREAVI
jgi:hypothetical protein